MNQSNDPFPEYWELDLTTGKAKEKYSSLIDLDYQKTIETQVSEFIQTNFSFCVFEVNSKEQRLQIESGLISTISWCEECKSSKTWLGNVSPKKKLLKVACGW
ncbi:MAG: hypothetical protein O7D86_02365 [Proteobacteria bacterium]|nr:hypothetical protein [Pseudomonadota bacterium]